MARIAALRPRPASGAAPNVENNPCEKTLRTPTRTSEIPAAILQTAPLMTDSTTRTVDRKPGIEAPNPRQSQRPDPASARRHETPSQRPSRTLTPGFGLRCRRLPGGAAIGPAFPPRSRTCRERGQERTPPTGLSPIFAGIGISRPVPVNRHERRGGCVTHAPSAVQSHNLLARTNFQVNKGRLAR